MQLRRAWPEGAAGPLVNILSKNPRLGAKAVKISTITVMNTAELVLRFRGTERRISINPHMPTGIGRSRQNLIPVESEAISRNHAMIQQDDSGMFCLYDLGSRNGTFLNDRVLAAPAPLRHGDVIQVGDATIQFFHDRRWNESASESADAEDIPINTVMVSDLVEVTVLVADIRGYTSLAAKAGASLTAEVIRAFNSDSYAILDANGVWTVKFIGDAVMALWMNRLRKPSDTIQAAVCSFISIHECTERLQNRFSLPVAVSIGGGINWGPACVGNLGGGGFADYTALGDTVNQAFRLEAATRAMNLDLVLGSEAYQLGKPLLPFDRFFTRHRILLKGYAGESEVYGTDIPSLREMFQVTGREK